jgi:hypothetical protein
MPGEGRGEPAAAPSSDCSRRRADDGSGLLSALAAVASAVPATGSGAAVNLQFRAARST